VFHLVIFSLLALIDNSELFIKVIDAEDNTRVEKLEGHSKGVRRVTWDPTSMYLVSLAKPKAITFRARPYFTDILWL